MNCNSSPETGLNGKSMSVPLPHKKLGTANNVLGFPDFQRLQADVFLKLHKSVGCTWHDMPVPSSRTPKDSSDSES